MNQHLTVVAYRPIYATVAADSKEAQSASADFVTPINLTDSVTSYTHSSTAIGGYDSSLIQIGRSLSDARFWLANGVGRDVRVTGPRGEVVWRGFVNSVTANIGGATFERGPYLDISNYVRVKYTTKRWDVIPPVGGEDAVTPWATDSNSVSRYGALYETLTGGEGTESEMLQMRDKYLSSFARPQGNINVQIGQSSGDEVQLSLDLRGYFHRMQKMTYEASTSGEGDTSDVVDDIIDPTEMPWVELKRIEANTTQTGQYYTTSEARTRDSILKEKAEKASSADVRFVYGFYSNGLFIYEQVPSVIEYIYASDRNVIVRAGSGSIVPMSEIRPAKWLYIAGPKGDFSTPSGLDELRASQNAIFIERVNFSYPDSVSLNGIRLDSLRERINSLGLGSNVN